MQQLVITVKQHPGPRRRGVSFSYDRFSLNALAATTEKIKGSHLVSDCYPRDTRARLNHTCIIVQGRWHWPFRGWLVEKVCRDIMESFHVPVATVEILHPLPGERRRNDCEQLKVCSPPPISQLETERMERDRAFTGIY